MIDRFETFTFAIFEILQSWNKIASNEMRCYNLKAAHAVYLIELLKSPEGITSANLCEICNKDKAEISRAVSIMEKNGLIKKERITNNSYRALIKLTDKGIKAAKQIEERAKIAVEAAGNGLTDKEREIFYSALEKIASNLKTLSKEGLPK